MSKNATKHPSGEHICFLTVGCVPLYLWNGLTDFHYNYDFWLI